MAAQVLHHETTAGPARAVLVAIDAGGARRIAGRVAGGSGRSGAAGLGRNRGWGGGLSEARSMLFRIGFIVALVFGAAAPAAAASPGAPIMGTVNGVVSSLNVDKPGSVAAWFTPSAVVVDDFAPYSWSGTNAALRWWMALDASNVKAGLRNLRITARPVSQFDVSGDIAYVVVPLDLSFTVKSKAEHQSGLWALTLQRSVGRWAIVSASWALATSTL